MVVPWFLIGIQVAMAVEAAARGNVWFSVYSVAGALINYAALQLARG